MMTFYRIRNIERFCQIIDTCAGGIFFQTDDGQYVDIRNNSLVKNLLSASAGRHGVEQLDLLAECTEDRMKLIEYMIGGSSVLCAGEE